MQDNSNDRLVFIFALIAAQVIGGTSTQLAPLVIGGVVVGLNLSAQQAGYVASAEFIVLSITAMLMAPVLPRFSYRTLCYYAACLAVAAHAASALVSELTLMLVLRSIAGIGEGCVYAISLAAVASHSVNPDKVYGYFQVAWAILSVALFSIGGYLTDMYAHRGIFWLLAFVTTILLFFLRNLPSNKTEVSEKKSADNSAASSLMGIVTLTGIFIYLAAGAAVYTFAAQLGVRAGLTTTQVGYVLTLGSAVGLIGAGLATWLNIRKGRFIPITTFSIWYALTNIVLCFNTDATIYIVAIMSSFISFYFAIPYLFGLAAALDKQGRWAAAAGSAYLLGFAVGPVYGGNMIEWYSYSSLGLASATTTMLAWALLVYVAVRLSMQKPVRKTGL